MALLRLIVATLPQIMLLLLLGGWLDLIGGFNQTDAGFGVVVLLFFLNPVATLILHIVETLKYRRSMAQQRVDSSGKWRGLSFLLFAQALVTNMFVLSQLKM